jgi:hypothetical protein
MVIPAGHRAAPDGIVLAASHPALLGSPLAAGALVQDNGGPLPGVDATDEEGWEFSFAPYFWAASIDGSVTVMGTRSTVDSSFTEMLENIDFAVEGTFKARKGETAFVLDATYLKFDADAEAGPLDLDIDADIWLVQTHVAQDLTDDGTLAAYAGVRYWSVDIDVDPSPGPTVGGDKHWYDPLVGLRKTWVLSEDGHWDLMTMGDVGGGGFGNWASEFSYQGAAVFRRRYESGNLLLGYRIVYTDYEDGSGANKFKFDNKLFGPVIGWVFRF